MADGLEWVGQDDFSAGAFPLQERVPRTAVEDAVNCLIEDDGSLLKRGGGAYKSTSAYGAAILALFDRVLGAGQRTVFLAADRIGQLVADDATPADIIGSTAGLGF